MSIWRRVFFSVLLASIAAFAQDRGTITGTVTDSSGAVVSGARATLKNPDTGLTQSQASGADGAYTFASLAAGRYNLTVEKEGFQKTESVGVLVEVNTATRVDVKLAVGAVAQNRAKSGNCISDAMFEVDERIGRPEFRAQLLGRDELTRTPEQDSQHLQGTPLNR